MWRKPVLVLVVGVLLLAGIAVGIRILSAANDRGRVDRAKVSVRNLTNAIHAWKIQHDSYPDSLAQLLAHPGFQRLLSPEDLTDPWGRPYDYDPAGPRNHETRPDIWTVTPWGELIGNW